MDNVSEVLAAALKFHQMGEWARAEEIYGQILQAYPQQADARHLLGLLMYQQGRHEAATQHLQQAVAADPTNAMAPTNLGEVYRQMGRLDEALACGRQAVQLGPELAAVHFGLGGTLFALQRWDEAEACYRRALELQPDHFESANNLGLVTATQGKFSEAIEFYFKAMELRPENAEVYFNLGLAFEQQKNYAFAEAYFRQAVRLKPDHGQAWNNLGVLLKERGRYDDALACYDEALRLRPQAADVHNNRAAALQALRRFDDALASYRQALQIKPDSVEACYNFGLLLHECGRFKEAQACYREALRLKPDFALAWNNLGTTLKACGQLEAAVVCFTQSAQINPAHLETQNNLSSAWQEQGRVAEAIDGYRRALAVEPSNAKIISNLLMVSNYDSRISPAALFAEHVHWTRMFPAAAISPAIARTPTVGRALRVGYMSPDFRRHAVEAFIEPVLAQHDPAQVEAILFAEVRWPDDVTERLRGIARGWHNTCGLTDAQFAELIRSEKIDILVDLAGHTNHNRLPVLNLRPAAVQVSYLGYPNTTGLASVDFRLTDAMVDPAGAEPLYTEKLVRLSPTFCCYQPSAEAPKVSPLPAQASGRITFGSMHNLVKLNSDVLDLWARLIQAAPGSRLLVFRDTLQDSTLQRLRQEFASRGLGEDRVELRGTLAPGERHWSVYREIDISLDAFPWSGHTTACESLWMGVPVISLRGDRAAGRMVTSVLSCLGLDPWSVADRDEYVDAAIRLAGDVEQLARWRSRLRELMLGSPLCDAKRFTRGLEEAYRGMVEV
jgi:protein O-GlcNAc transferase